VIKAFVELFRYDETADFTKNLKGSISTLMFLSEKRIISWASYVPRNLSVFKQITSFLLNKIPSSDLIMPHLEEQLHR
jgi:hypothetical protein